MIKYLWSIILIAISTLVVYLAYTNWAVPNVNLADYGYNGPQDYYIYVLDTNAYNYLLNESGLTFQLISVASASTTTFKFPDKTTADNTLREWVKSSSDSGSTLAPPQYCKYIYLFVPMSAENIADSVYDSDYFFQCHGELPSSQLKNLSLTGI